MTVLYPSINCEFFDNALRKFKEDGIDEIEKSLSVDLVDLLKQKETISFLSVNRFERKKNIELAIQSFGYFNKLNFLINFLSLLAFQNFGRKFK